MSMKPQEIPEISPETVRVVCAVFPKGNIYTHLRDTLGTTYQDELFADLYPDRGQPAYAPWPLALVTGSVRTENPKGLDTTEVSHLSLEGYLHRCLYGFKPIKENSSLL